MPKIVDHNERRKLIAQATLNIISREGIQGASVRSIAKEAKLSLGAVRHYFNTQEELLEFAMNLIEEQVNERIYELAKLPLKPKEAVLKMLMELLPFDEKEIEMKIWLEYVLYKIRKNETGEDKIYKGLKELFFKINKAGFLKENISLEKEIVQLHALIDGLALHIVMGVVNLSKKEVEKMIESELDRLFK